MDKKISIEEFLSREPAKQAFLATIEKSENDDAKIIIKQYFEYEDNCSCDRSFEIYKDLIQEVKLTEITKKCCGGIHNVVEVVFIENFSLDFNGFMAILNKFTTELNKKNIRESNPDHQTLPLQTKDGQCWPGMRQCDPKNPYDCYNPQTQCCCYDPVGQRYFIKTNSGNCGWSCNH